MLKLPEGYTLQQAYNDIMFLAYRQRALEEAISEWSEFLTVELLKNDVRLEKHKTTFRYFKESLKDKFKADYDKFEDVYSKLNKYFDKKKREPQKGIVPL